MAFSIATTRLLYQALKDEGFPLPEECREARLVMGTNHAFMIQYDVFVTGENLGKLGRALQRLAGPMVDPVVQDIRNDITADLKRSDWYQRDPEHCEICAPQEQRLERRRCDAHATGVMV